MAAFASDRRSGWVRVLVLILCALFIFATVATPPAYAVGETVALFGLAAVLSAATAALGFKLANNAEGQATLEKMVQDFTGASIAAGLVLTGSKVNGLINGMQYIKMAVHNGKTYLDERIFAWCQQWLAKNGVYDTGGISVSPNMFSEQGILDASGGATSFPISIKSYFSDGGYFSSTVTFDYNYVKDYFGLEGLPDLQYSRHWNDGRYVVGWSDFDKSKFCIVYDTGRSFSLMTRNINGVLYLVPNMTPQGYVSTDNGKTWNFTTYIGVNVLWALDGSDSVYGLGNFLPVVAASNNTGLSGTDTLGKDVIDLTLDQILERLKEWAQDWYDAGADSVTNAATGAKDLPLSVATGAATLNPDVAEDGPLVYFPTFGWSLPKLRSGETDSKTVDQGKENASSAETSVDVAENQTVIDSLVNWALGYISPDTGLFSKFPLCVPYDAYLLACSALGVGVVGSDSIFGASPDDLSSIVQTGDEQSEGFTPVITISNDLTLDGNTYPIDFTIDLTDWTPLIKFVRLAISITVIAELIGAEYKRIKGK